jgi:hypothetical protein
MPAANSNNGKIWGKGTMAKWRSTRRAEYAGESRLLRIHSCTAACVRVVSNMVMSSSSSKSGIGEVMATVWG